MSFDPRSQRPRVKFCGMTRREDAVAAADLGADAVGFVFWARSPRAVSPEDARTIVRALPHGIDKVGVFVDADRIEVERIAARVGLTAVQLHGDERPDAIGFDGLATIKAVAGGGSALDDAARVAGAWPEDVSLLLDARDEQRRGGTGERADWQLARALTAMRPLILAGGLRPENVAAAIRAVLPFALDTASGVETAPGIKDHRRMRAFLDAVRAGWHALAMDHGEVWRARVQFQGAPASGLRRALPRAAITDGAHD